MENFDLQAVQASSNTAQITSIAAGNWVIVFLLFISISQLNEIY